MSKQQSPSFSDADRHHMQLALEIAERGAGYVSPNPMVGCVIVDESGTKVGQGYHERHGQAHAEVNALQSVVRPQSLENATVYVTLEPCSHHGETPPCCEELAKHPIKRVVVAMKDPNPKVNGKGVRYLREHGIAVSVGLMKAKAEQLNEFFLHHTRFGRPFITLKMAQTVDGYIAAADGNSQWITGQAARTKVHEWRSRYDAVMVGRNTAFNDNPRLTVRHVEGRQPRRIVLDGPLELPDRLNLFSDQHEEKTIVVTHNSKKLEDEGDPMLKMLSTNYFRGQTLLVSERNGHTNLEEAIKKLGAQGITSMLVEAGQNLATALLRQHLVDKLQCFIAPKLLGAGTRSVLDIGVNRMEDIRPLRQPQWQQIGDDMLLTSYL